MKFLKIPFWLLWRVWFYVMMALPILIMFPFLFVSILKETWYPYFFKLARVWAKVVLFGMGFYKKINVIEPINPNKSYMFVANHTSMTDIMLMLASVKNPFVFVGKQELVKIPLFGFFYKRTCILVDRNNPRSRQAVFERAQKRINQGLSICIFPEGKVPDDETVVLDEFKDGAFRLALEHKLPIKPLVFHDNKVKYSYTIFSGYPGKLRVTVLPEIAANYTFADFKKEVKALREKTRNVILEELNTVN